MSNIRFNIYGGRYKGYWIEIITDDIRFPITHDKQIAEILNLDIKAYEKILQHFNGEKNYLMHKFSDVRDANRALNYLNDKYGVLLKLMGD